MIKHTNRISPILHDLTVFQVPKYKLGIFWTDKWVKNKINAEEISSCKFNDRGSYRLESYPGRVEKLLVV